MWRKQDNACLAPIESWNQSNNFIIYSLTIFVSLLLDDVEIIKEVTQKTIESSDFDTNEDNETSNFIPPAVALSSVVQSKKVLGISKCLYW